MRDRIVRNKRILVALVAFILLIAGIIVKGGLTDSGSTAEPWRRWSSDGDRFGYVAAYFPEKEGIDSDQIMSYRDSLKNALTEASIEVKEGQAGFTDAYSLSGSVNVQKAGNSNMRLVNVTAVGGNFFFMHPFYLLSGNYIEEDDLMEDRVVIDEETAWFLYGSSNVAGQSVTIEGKNFFIAGVIRPNGNESAKKTYGTRSRIFMSYKAYKKINENAVITCYELVYPDLVRNFAQKTLRKTLGMAESDDSTEAADASQSDKTIETVNYSTRFGIANIWSTMLSYGDRSAHSNGIIYPFWENEYRRIEDMLVINMLWNVIWIAVIVISVFGYVVAICKLAYGLVITIWDKIMSRLRPYR